MYVSLTVLTEVEQGASFFLASGQQAKFGRTKAESHFCVADRYLAPVHLTLRCEAARCTLRDESQGVRLHKRCGEHCFVDTLRNAKCGAKQCELFDVSGENGVYVNGKKVREHVLAHGDVIVAGSTGLLVSVSEAPFSATSVAAAPAAASLPPNQQERALALLREPKVPLFAILDAARSVALLHQLRMHDEVYYSLYDGSEGEKLAEVAPYLVALPAGSALTEVLVREYLGDNFGCFLYSQADFKTLRRHLRRFLIVEGHDKQSMYFRFYDPRVLRSFLPTCTTAECSEFFGPVLRFVTEAEQPGALWLFSQGPRGLEQDPVRL